MTEICESYETSFPNVQDYLHNIGQHITIMVAYQKKEQKETNR